MCNCSMPCWERGVWSIYELHSLGRLVEKHVSTTLTFGRKLTGPLITACLGTSQDPEDSFDDKVGDEPSDMAC